MTLTDILLLANLGVIGAIAVWQQRRLAALDDRMASRTHLALATKVFKLRGDKLTERQAAVEAALAGLPKVLEARFKEYARSERVAKLENSLDERITHAITLAAATPADKAHKVCSRCGRAVARYQEFDDPSHTIMCSNCHYDPDYK